MPALLAATATSPDHHARVITTSSSGAMYGKIDFDSFRDGPRRKRYSTERLYAQSKLVSDTRRSSSQHEMRLTYSASGKCDRRSRSRETVW